MEEVKRVPLIEFIFDWHCPHDNCKYNERYQYKSFVEKICECDNEDFINKFMKGLRYSLTDELVKDDYVWVLEENATFDCPFYRDWRDK